MTDTYLTVANFCEGFFKDRNSKFVSLVFPVSSEEEILEIYKQVKKKYHDAHHHCFAYRLGALREKYRASDDGEPANSAGKPILAQIDARNLTNILIIVVRYFGGTLLGVGGLINAFRTATIDALSKAEIITRIVEIPVEITFDYAAMNNVMRVIKDENLKPVNQKFEQNCSLTVSVRKSVLEKIIEKLTKIETVRICDMSILFS